MKKINSFIFGLVLKYNITDRILKNIALCKKSVNYKYYKDSLEKSNKTYRKSVIQRKL